MLTKRIPRFNGFTFDEKHALEMLKRELEMGRIIEIYKGYDAFGKFDGSYTVNSFVNADYIKRQSI